MMNTNASKTANVLGGKTVKACDSCLRKRARWFCAADDAFLCQSCDNKVHSANQLASRHERVRIGTSSSKAIDTKGDGSAPAWHNGFTRKARTPRYGKQTMHKKESDAIFHPLPLVPEIGSDETTLEENEEQLLFRVPVFDPLDAELCSVPTDMDGRPEGDEITIGNELEALLYNRDGTCDLEIPELLGSEMELAEFSAEVESLLRTGLDEVIDPYGNDQEGNILDIFFERSKVKMEDDNEEVKNVIACHLDPALDMAPGESLNWDFDYEIGEQQVEQKIADQVTKTPSSNSGNQVGVGCKRKRLLILNHEAVITAWNNQGSPWADGVRPKFNPDDCWSDILGACGGEQHTYGTFGVKGRDGGREARVSRYREKRRTRLYSRKIRYEVRKLNAEKRPRMKGRFVKRTDIAGTSNLSPYMINKSS